MKERLCSFLLVLGAYEYCHARIAKLIVFTLCAYRLFPLVNFSLMNENNTENSPLKETELSTKKEIEIQQQCFALAKFSPFQTALRISH